MVAPLEYYIGPSSQEENLIVAYSCNCVSENIVQLLAELFTYCEQTIFKKGRKFYHNYKLPPKLEWS